MDRRMRGDALPAPAEASPELAAVILKACAYRPEDRYRTAAEMLADLKSVKEPSGSRMAASIADYVQEEKTVGMFCTVPKKGRDVYQGLNLEAGFAQTGCTQKMMIRGKPVLVKIPAGIRNEEEIRIRGLGEQGINGGEDGDFCIRVYIKHQTMYVSADPDTVRNGKKTVRESEPRKGMDVYHGINLDATLARTGCTQRIMIQGKPVLVTIPAGIRSGQEIRLRGLGKPGINGGADGDFCIRVYI